MWSSLSAYLYNDDDAKDSVAASSSPSATAAVPRHPTSTRNNISPASNSLRTPSPRSSPLTIAMSGGSKKGSPSPSLSRASFDKSDNVSILRGVIVGMKETGKTSLIRRLRGEDPFQKHQSKSGQQRTNADKRKLMALVPWNVPPNAEKTNNLVIEQEERVQLYVSESVGFVQTQEKQSFRKEWSAALQAQRGKEWNFVVWIIDPNMAGMLQYLQLGLEILYPASAAAAAASEKRKLPLVQHLCILLNFRDIHEDDKSSTFSQARKIVETVRKNTEMRNDDAKSPIVVVYESSMRDCFGLEQLHSFITLPYLAQKENELLRRVKLAQKQQIHLTKTLMESKVADYNDFVASDDQLDIEKKPDTQKQTIERRRLEEEKVRLKKQLKQQKQELDSRMHSRKSPVIIDDQIVSNESPKEIHRETIQGSMAHNRKLFQTPSKPETTKSAEPQKVVGEMSLESFFSEDESDDEVEAPRQIIGKRGNQNGTQMKATARVQVLDSDDSSSDSDDSDDDFYIDISGTRSSADFTKIRKIEPSVTVDSSEGIQSNAEGKDGDASNGSISSENKEKGAENEKDPGSIKSGAGAAGEEQEKAIDATEHEEGSSNEEDDKEENGEPNSNEADESENANAPSKPIDSDACPEDANSGADSAVSSHSGDKKREKGDDTSSIDYDEINNGKDSDGEPEVPAKGSNIENDTATTEAEETTEANDDSAETDSSGTVSSVTKTEEEKKVPHPPNNGVAEEENVAADEALQEQHLDDVSEEKSTSAAPNHQNQTLDNDDESEEDGSTSSSPKEDTLDDDENESDDEFIVSASNDDDDDSEDEFIVPASKEEQSDTEPSKVSEDFVDAVLETDNVSIESDRISPTQSGKHFVNVVAETKTNGTSATSNNNIATVSSAALAAIEQARLEAEQMMVQSQPTKPKKEKKKKKEKYKKEKKAKKSKKKEESSS